MTERVNIFLQQQNIEVAKALLAGKFIEPADITVDLVARTHTYASIGAICGMMPDAFWVELFRMHGVSISNIFTSSFPLKMDRGSWLQVTANAVTYNHGELLASVLAHIDFTLTEAESILLLNDAVARKNASACLELVKSPKITIPDDFTIRNQTWMACTVLTKRQRKAVKARAIGDHKALIEQNAELTAVNTELKKQLDDLTAKNAELTKQLADAPRSATIPNDIAMVIIKQCPSVTIEKLVELGFFNLTTCTDISRFPVHMLPMLTHITPAQWGQYLLNCTNTDHTNMILDNITFELSDEDATKYLVSKSARCDDEFSKYITRFAPDAAKCEAVFNKCVASQWGGTLMMLFNHPKFILPIGRASDISFSSQCAKEYIATENKTVIAKLQAELARKDAELASVKQALGQI